MKTLHVALCYGGIQVKDRSTVVWLWMSPAECLKASL